MPRAIRMFMVAASLAAAAPARAEDPGVTVGRYEGTAVNTTANQGGKVVLEITSVRAGRVQARFAASDGLSGEGWLSGTLAGGTLTLAGPLSGWRMSLTASMRPDGELAGTYTVEGEGTQQGRFQVARRGPASPVLAEGHPPLTVEMATRFLDLYDGLLELHLDAAGRRRVTGSLADAWRKNDRTVIELVLEDLTSTSGKSLEAVQADFGPDKRLALAESARRNAPHNAVLAALIAAFDQAHPDRIAATRARGFSDLVGKWEWGDAMAPMQHDFSGAPSGISFSAADGLEIEADHRFTRAKVREHCGGSGGARCCQNYQLGWQGTADVESGDLVLRIASGVESLRDSCRPGHVQRAKVPAHVKKVRWTMPVDPARANAPLLCWEPKGEQPVCYRKQ